MIGDRPSFDMPLVGAWSFRSLLVACATGSARERAEARQIISGLSHEDLTATLGSPQEAFPEGIEPSRRVQIAAWFIETRILMSQG